VTFLEASTPVESMTELDQLGTRPNEIRTVCWRQTGGLISSTDRQAKAGPVGGFGLVEIIHIDDCFNDLRNARVSCVRCRHDSIHGRGWLQTQAFPQSRCLFFVFLQAIGIRGEHRQGPLVGLPYCRTDDSLQLLVS
jgi:hypothetical protein